MAKLNKIMPPRNTTIRGQDHLLAYITPEEAQLLMDNGGSGEAGPMGIPAYADTGGPAGADDTAEEGGGYSAADADQGFGFGGATGGTGLGDMLSGYLSSGPIGIIGDFLDRTVGLEPHGPNSGGGSGGDGYDSTYSGLSKFYGGGGGGSSYNRCPEGYVFDPDLGACRLATQSEQNQSNLNSAFATPSSGGYARMGLLDRAPAGLADFTARYGLTGYTNPADYEAQNLMFRRQGATYPEFFKTPPSLQGYANLNTGQAVPASGVVPSYATAPATVPATASPPAQGASNPYIVNGVNMTPAGAIVANIAALGIDDPVIAAAQEALGPASGGWEREFNIAANLPTPLGYHSRGQYLQSLVSASKAGYGGLNPIIQSDDTGRTTGVYFMEVEGDG